eukprot:s280_g30.t1
MRRVGRAGVNSCGPVTWQKLPHVLWNLKENESGLRLVVTGLFLQCQPQMAPNVVGNLALAYSESQVYIPELYECVAQVCVESIHDFKPRQLVTLAGSFAKAQVKHDALFKCMSKHVAKNVEDFQREDLQDLFNAFQALGVSKNEVQRALEVQEKGPVAPVSLRTFLLIVALILLTLVVWRI